MKTSKLINSFAFFFAFLVVADAYSQTRDRPSSGRTSPRTGESTSTGTTYSGGSSSSGGSGYSGGSSSSGSSSSGSTYSGGSYTPTRSRVGAPYNRRTAPVISSRRNHEPIRSGQVRNVRHYSSGSYKPARHRPTTYERVPTRIRYQAASDYHHRVHRSFIYIRWVLEPAHYRYGEGHCYYDDYDWYVYQGYRHRYSNEDKCDYELIDTRTNTVVQSFLNTSCKQAYDDCAVQRDILIASADYWDLKDYYVCAEKVDETLENRSSTSLPSVTSALPAETIAQISSFIEEKSTGQLYKVGSRDLNGCKIEKAPKNEARCNYMITVDGKPYPDPDGKVCSSRKTLAGYGCNSRSQRSNAVCLFSLAVMEGLCLAEDGSL